MKKIIPAIILLLLIANSFWSCEKDDIRSNAELDGGFGNVSASAPPTEYLKFETGFSTVRLSLS